MSLSVLFPFVLHILTQKAHADEEVPLIPRELLFGNPERTKVDISPDGKWLSYCAPFEGVLNVAVQKILANGEINSTVEFVTKYTGRSVSSYEWTYLPDTLIFIRDHDGDEHWKLYKVNVNTSEVVVLSDTNGVRAEFKSSSQNHPTKIMVGLNDRDNRFQDVYEINLETGEKKLVFENKEFGGIFFDNDMHIRLAVKYNDDADLVYSVPVKNSSGLIDSWKLYLQLELKESYGRYPKKFSADNRFLYWIGRCNENLPLIVKKDFDKPTETGELIYTPKKAEVDDVFFHPTEYTIISVTENYGKPERYILDQSYKWYFDSVAHFLESEYFSVMRASLNMKIWLIKLFASDAPTRYYLVHLDSNRIPYLFTNQPELEKYKFAKTKPIEVKTSNKLTQVCYFTQPLGIEMKPYPLVLLVHAGPSSRDYWGFNSSVQWMANRGFAVLSCNFRGSKGYGKEHFAAGFGERGRKMHHDLLDGVGDVIKRGWVDPKRVAIYGRGYGGYSALVGLAFTPNHFACGISMAGFSNLVTRINSLSPIYLPAKKAYMKRVGGSPGTERGRQFLYSRSPLSSTVNIRSPLFMAHGANDIRVKISESDQFVAKMKGSNVSVTYLVAGNEGHIFHRPENKIVYYERVEKFLHQCLGGRTPEPIDPENLQKSNVTIKMIS